MRLWIFGCIAVVLLAAIFAGYLSLATSGGGDVAAYVPRDAPFVMTVGSLNEVREALGGIGRTNADPALEIVGRKTNLPGLEGLDFVRPVVSYVSSDLQEHWLLPVRNWGAMEEAFKVSRENLHLRDPRRLADDYAYLSAERKTPSAGAGHPDLHRLLEHAVATRMILGGRARFDLFFGFPFAQRQGRRVPDRALLFLERNCEDLGIGLRRLEGADAPAVFDLSAALRDGALARAGPLAGKQDVSELLAALPAFTQLFVAVVLDAEGWKSLGLPLEIGDAAVALAGVHTNDPHRPLAFMAVARPFDPERLPARIPDPRALAEVFGIALGGPEVAPYGAAQILTWTLDAPPPFLAAMLKPRRGQKAKPATMSVTAEKGFFLLAVGSGTKGIVQTGLAGIRGAAHASAAAVQQVSAHRGMLAPGHVAVGMATEQGMRALGDSLPEFQAIRIGKPTTATFWLDVDAGSGRVNAEVRLSR